MKSRDPVEVTINRVAGDGCGYSDDVRLAVYGALTDETVTATPFARKKKKVFYRATNIINPSVDRVTPACSAALICGGCSFQHMSTQAQLRLKFDTLKQHFGELQPVTWLAPVTAADYHYRSKARLGVKFVVKKDRVLVGFREKHKPYITDISTCPVLRESVAELIEPLQVLIAALSRPMSWPQIEVAVGDDQTALVFRHLEELGPGDTESLSQFGKQWQISIYLQPAGPDSTYKLYPENEDLLSYCLPEFDLTFEFGPLDFTQVNLAINQKMVSKAVELLACTDKDRVFDGFCGIGNFSLALARRVKDVYGAEQSAASIARARLNAAKNGIKNVQFEVVDLQSEPDQIHEISSVNKALLDPPRSGAFDLVKKLASCDVERVVYVSCNPETLARDAKYLVESGFELRSAGIIDMFPHTTHVESIALLAR